MRWWAAWTRSTRRWRMRIGRPRASTFRRFCMRRRFPRAWRGGGCRRRITAWTQALDHNLIEKAAPALESQAKVTGSFAIRNVHRTVGAMLGGQIARKYGSAGLPDGTIHFQFQGSAGQSFGAFVPSGVTLELEGDANDYLGKGLSGGRIIAYPPKTSSFLPEESILVGNVVLYGATSGEVFLNGIAGERFAVRNSGATAVVEGRGRPRLRVHDQRDGDCAGQDGTKLCGGHERRHCVCLRRAGRLCGEALQQGERGPGAAGAGGRCGTGARV